MSITDRDIRELRAANLIFDHELRACFSDDPVVAENARARAAQVRAQQIRGEHAPLAPHEREHLARRLLEATSSHSRTDLDVRLLRLLGVDPPVEMEPSWVRYASCVERLAVPGGHLYSVQRSTTSAVVWVPTMPANLSEHIERAMREVDEGLEKLRRP